MKGMKGITSRIRWQKSCKKSVHIPTFQCVEVRPQPGSGSARYTKLRKIDGRCYLILCFFLISLEILDFHISASKSLLEFVHSGKRLVQLFLYLLHFSLVLSLQVIQLEVVSLMHLVKLGLRDPWRSRTRSTICLWGIGLCRYRRFQCRQFPFKIGKLD